MPGALGHGPVEAVLGFFLVLPVADEYLPLLSVSFAPTGLSDAAWPLVELKTETEVARREKKQTLCYNDLNLLTINRPSWQCSVR